ncbi:hypothetical protein GRJ2_003382800 [Grus japonensis]|uniref:Envelope glycoprotein n=1 Tax=Grus japonensis TaxID=30415 RepID=A0ABC9YGX3_GRUJA
MKAFWGHWTVIVNNRLYIENLTWQVETLANWTRTAIEASNTQLQATSQMTLQNRLALDILLLKENGICGWLNNTYPDETCCVSIPNVSVTLHEAMDEMRKIADQTRELREKMKPADWQWTGWISKVFGWFGLKMSGWVQNLIQYALMFIIMIVIVGIGLSCVKTMITRAVTAQVRMLQVCDTEYVPLIPSPIENYENENTGERDGSLNPPKSKLYDVPLGEL